jgi:CubicO group peptidase (beta-lactamase class C family)
MMKGDKIFAEYYWAPFHQEFCHRMYSQTKSYVGIAIGLLVDDGKLDLDAKIASFFPEKIDQPLAPELAEQTVRQMLTMTTCGKSPSWFRSDDPDRTHLYFQPREKYRPAGTIWEYDSPGSQVLTNLVEKLSGKKLFDFMYERMFSHMGTFKTATILQTPNGDSWGDSALLCTTRDMASFGRLLMQNGKWDGKQLVSEAYVKEATSKVVDNREDAHEDFWSRGYGYQIWRTDYNSFGFNGMGCQMTVCCPEKDFLFTITSDNQGLATAKNSIIGGVMDLILGEMSTQPLPKDEIAEKELEEVTKDLKLRAVQGNADSPLRSEIAGVTYQCEPNPLGMTKFRFEFDGTEMGTFYYTNEQGDKEIPFGINKNVFGKFPQLGYANEKGRVATTDGFMYDDAVSLCWAQDNRIMMYVQIIDKYFGNMTATFGFQGDSVACHFTRAAEHFLMEYDGEFVAKRMK